MVCRHHGRALFVILSVYSLTWMQRNGDHWNFGQQSSIRRTGRSLYHLTWLSRAEYFAFRFIYWSIYRALYHVSKAMVYDAHASGTKSISISFSRK